MDDSVGYGVIGLIVGFVLGILVSRLVVAPRNVITEVIRDDKGRIMQIVEMSR